MSLDLVVVRIVPHCAGDDNTLTQYKSEKEAEEHRCEDVHVGRWVSSAWSTTRMKDGFRELYTSAVLGRELSFGDTNMEAPPWNHGWASTW